MSKQERLRDREQQRAGLVADRDQLVRTCNCRHRRTKLIQQATRRIRDAREIIERAVAEIAQVRSASAPPDGLIYQQIDKRDAGIKQCNKELVTLRAEARIERLLQMAAEVNRLNRELAGGNPDAIDDDDIV